MAVPVEEVPDPVLKLMILGLPFDATEAEFAAARAEQPEYVIVLRRNAYLPDGRVMECLLEFSQL